VSLALEFSWAHDCAFSPDGSALAVAYHGCHVVIFDATTGKRLRTIEGSGGVPDATKRLAFAPNGEHLAFAGSDGSARHGPLAHRRVGVVDKTRGPAASRRSTSTPTAPVSSATSKPGAARTTTCSASAPGRAAPRASP
jgi:WD40 repeat protein